MRPRCRADFVVCRILVVFVLLRALCAGEDVVARIVFARARLVAKGSTVDELLVGDPHGVGTRDVEVQVPGRRGGDGGDAREEDVCLLVVREGLGLARRDARVGVEVVDDRRLDVLVRLLALVCLAAVGHQVVTVPHLDGLPRPPDRLGVVGRMSFNGREPSRVSEVSDSLMRATSEGDKGVTRRESTVVEVHRHLFTRRWRSALAGSARRWRREQLEDA